MGAEWLSGVIVACTLLYITQWRGVPFEVRGWVGGREDEGTTKNKLRLERKQRQEAEKKEKELKKRLAAIATQAGAGTPKGLGIGPLRLAVHLDPDFRLPFKFGHLSGLHLSNEVVTPPVTPTTMPLAKSPKVLKWKERKSGKKFVRTYFIAVVERYPSWILDTQATKNEVHKSQGWGLFIDSNKAPVAGYCLFFV
ncbi:hypothetical protein KFL_005750010 [Klebsormidium nitens]|uniref:Uncharacterized protein n=1 Tax=Klebsormidium nitens TaxID=105231 RepID=A0A1Y1IGD1_KLENI|nr:hypothetical protein KFL_005750010 [Klebsormidium nitens]|eukprot:GAQ89900.1 hypothetical protein KFL_005750010 [Klebsormidium nitens]